MMRLVHSSILTKITTHFEAFKIFFFPIIEALSSAPFKFQRITRKSIFQFFKLFIIIIIFFLLKALLLNS